MKRLLTATFLLFYSACSVTLVVERAHSAASTFGKAHKSQSVEVRAYSPDASPKRIEEHPFTVTPDPATFALDRLELGGIQVLSTGYGSDVNSCSLSRAPPTILLSHKS